MRYIEYYTAPSTSQLPNLFIYYEGSLVQNLDMDLTLVNCRY